MVSEGRGIAVQCGSSNATSSRVPTAHPNDERTFTGRTHNAAGGRSKPNNSTAKRPTPPARGPRSSGNPAMLLQRTGLRSGELAGKRATPGLRGSAAARASEPPPAPPPDSPSTQPPSLRCHLTHAQIGRSGSPCIAHTMAMPKRQDASFKDGCHGSRRAVAGATDFAVALADMGRKKCPLWSGVGPDLPPWGDALGYTWLNKQLHRA